MPGTLFRGDRAVVALSVMLDVAFHCGRAQVVSAGDIADRLGLARRGMEPLLQALSRERLLDSVRGPRGGYRLGRPAREITLAEIVTAATGQETVAADAPRGDLHAVAVGPFWQEMERMLWHRLANLALSDLIRRAEADGLRRPAREPISYAI